MNGYVIGKILETHHIEAGFSFVKALKILDDGSSRDIRLHDPLPENQIAVVIFDFEFKNDFRYYFIGKKKNKK